MDLEWMQDKFAERLAGFRPTERGMCLHENSHRRR